MQAWKGEIYFSLKIETTSWNLKAHAQKLVDLSPVMDELFNLSEDRKILVESWGELWVEFLVKKKSHEMGFQHGRYRFNLGNPLRETKNNKSMEHVRKLPAGRPEKTPTDSVGCCCCCRANTRTCCPPPHTVPGFASLSLFPVAEWKTSLTLLSLDFRRNGCAPSRSSFIRPP